jgi:hypothetical protein
MLVAVLDDELRRRLVRAEVGAAAFSPSNLANKFRISVRETTPCKFPNINPGGVAPRGGVVGYC